VGLPTGAERCSECGANLKRRRAIRIGHRRTPRLLLLLALLLLLGNGGWLSIRAHQFVTENDLSAYKPVWWLLIDARSADSQKRDPAFSRLLQLLEQNKLNASQTSSVIQLILAAQADPNRQWSAQWGACFERMHERQLVGAKEWQTYWRQAYSLTIETAEKDDELVVYLVQSKRPRHSGQFSDPAAALVTVTRWCHFARP
jgi:hypothetical protein